MAQEGDLTALLRNLDAVIHEAGAECDARAMAAYRCGDRVVGPKSNVWSRFPDWVLSFHKVYLHLTYGPLGDKERRLHETHGLMYGLMETMDGTDDGPRARRAEDLIFRYCDVIPMEGIPLIVNPAVQPLAQEIASFRDECEFQLAHSLGKYGTSYFIALICAFQGIRYSFRDHVVFPVQARREYSNRVRFFIPQVPELPDSPLGKKMARALEDYCNVSVD